METELQSNQTGIAQFSRAPKLVKAEDWPAWSEYIQRQAAQLGIHDFNVDVIGVTEDGKDIFYDPEETSSDPGPPPVATTEKGIVNKEAFQIWNMQYTYYQNEKKAKATLLNRIYDTVDPHIIRGQGTSIQKVLMHLNKHFSCKTKQFEDRIEDLYDRLRKGQAENETVDQYTNSWLDLALMTDRNGSGILSKRKLLKGFIEGSQEINASFFHMSTMRFHDEKDNLTLEEAIKLYKAATPDRLNAKQPEIAIAMATSRPDNNRNKNNSNTSNQPPGRCICGGSHWFSECYYLTPSLAPSNFKFREKTKDLVVKKLKNDKLKSMVQRALDRVEAKRTLNSDQTLATQAVPADTSNDIINFTVTWEPAVCAHDFIVNQPDILLARQWIYDSGSEIHICNQKYRFKTYQDLPQNQQDWVKHGTTRTRIQGYGTVELEVTGPTERSKRIINLRNVAYVPGFIANIVAQHILIEQDYFWNQATNWVEKEGNVQKRLMKLKKERGHWIVSTDDPISSATSVLSALPALPDPDPNSINQKGLLCPDPRSDQTSANEMALTISNSTTTEDPDLSLMSISQINRDQIIAHPISSYTLPQSNAPPMLWHARLAHLGKPALEHLETSTQGAILTNNLIPNAVNTNPNTAGQRICQVCAESNIRRQVSRVPTERGKNPFEQIHMDIVFPKPVSLLGDTQFIHFYCDYARFHLVFPTKDRSEETVKGCIKAVIALATRYKWKVYTIRSDGEGALRSTLLKDLFIEYSITYQSTVATTPEQNGLAESSGDLLIRKARALRLQAGLPDMLWPDLIQTAAYLDNRTPKRDIRWRTPYELVFGSQPYLGNIRIIGSKSFILDKAIAPGNKLQPRAYIGYLIGYDAHNIWRFWIPSRRSIVRARDVIIDENSSYKDDQQDQLLQLESIPMPVSPPHIPVPRVQPYVYIPTHQDDAMPRISPDQLSITGDQDPDLSPTEEIQSPIPQDRPMTRSFTRSQQEASTRIPDSDTSCDELAYATAFQRVFTSFLAALERQPAPGNAKNPLPPENWKEVQSHLYKDRWIDAAKAEIDVLEKKGIWETVDRADLSPRTQVIPLRWVFTYKTDQSGKIQRFKARICVRGDLQNGNIIDTYSATGSYRTFRCLCAYIAALDLDADQIDIVCAYANAQIDKEIYVKFPPGFDIPGKCKRLLRALYGLKRSARLWNMEITSTCQKELGMKPIFEDPCLLIRDTSQKDLLIIYIYVDDIILAGSRPQINQAKKAILARYESKDLGEIHWFLNIKIERDRPKRKLWLTQKAYTNKLMQKYNLISTKPSKATIPLTKNHAILPVNQGTATDSQIHEFQDKIGSMIYAAMSLRPDIARATSMLANHMQNPSREHLLEADHLIQYLYQTRSLALTFDGTKPNIQAASDAAYANEAARLSSYGYIFHLYGGAVSWKSSKLRSVVTSTTEAELMAASHSAKELISLERLLTQFKIDKDLKQATLLLDNTQTMQLLLGEYPQLTTKAKHIDIHYLWLRQEVQKGRIHIEWVPTKDMPADGLTKLLPKQEHIKFIKACGLTLQG